MPARLIDLDRDNVAGVMQRLKPRWEGVVSDPTGRENAELVLPAHQTGSHFTTPPGLSLRTRLPEHFA
jgi:hypothetical protein